MLPIVFKIRDTCLGSDLSPYHLPPCSLRCVSLTFLLVPKQAFAFQLTLLGTLFSHFPTLLTSVGSLFHVASSEGPSLTTPWQPVPEILTFHQA